jgi:hypothetical protein
MLQRTFVRRNLFNSDRIPENIPQSTRLDNKLFDRIAERLKSYSENELPHPISHRSLQESPCEIGYVKSGYDVKVYLIKDGVACLIDHYQALTHDGKDVIQKQIVLFHENSSGLESLCRELNL